MNEDVKRAFEAFAAERRAFWANPPRGTCPDCGAGDDVILHGDPGVCASCSAKKADRGAAYPCDECGASPSFRDPLGRADEYYCAECHGKRGYVPTERAMVTKVQTRVGWEHKDGRRDPCTARGRGTDCGGEVKPRGKKGVLCARHNDPVKWMKGKQG